MLSLVMLVYHRQVIYNDFYKSMKGTPKVQLDLNFRGANDV